MVKYGFLLVLLISSCATHTDTRVAYLQKNSLNTSVESPLLSVTQKTRVTPPVLVRPAQAMLPLAYYHTSRNDVTLSMVSFDDRVHQLRVADQQNDE